MLIIKLDFFLDLLIFSFKILRQLIHEAIKKLNSTKLPIICEYTCIGKYNTKKMEIISWKYKGQQRRSWPKNDAKQSCYSNIA